MNVNAAIALVAILGFAWPVLSFCQTAADKQKQIEAYDHRIQTDLAQKRPDLAIPVLEALVAIDPKNVNAQGNLGVLLFFQNDFAKSIPHLREALVLQPSLTKLQVLIGIAETHTGSPAAAQRDLEAAFPLVSDPHLRLEAGLELVDLYTASDNLASAASVLVTLNQVAPANKEVLYASYQTYTDLANKSMLTLSLVAADSPQMHQILAHEDLKEGNTNGAIAQYRKAIALNPGLPGVHFELAEVLYTADDLSVKQKALPEFQEALKQNPEDVKSMCRLGEIDLQNGNVSEASAYYSKAVGLHPDDAEANFGLAKTLIEMDQTSKALPILERAVQLDPTNATAHYRLSMLYRENGRREDATKELAEFQKYKQVREKLQAVYRDLRIVPQQIRAEEQTEKP